MLEFFGISLQSIEEFQFYYGSTKKKMKEKFKNNFIKKFVINILINIKY